MTSDDSSNKTMGSSSPNRRNEVVYEMPPAGAAVNCGQSPIGGSSQRVMTLRARIARKYFEREDLEKDHCISNFIL